MTAKTLMIQGTMSSVGKSLLVTALCRLFARQGVRVTPFKAQNMSNNAAVCADGGEIGRAQYTQALAAGLEPRVEMNPVLLKPEADARSQVIVMGRRWETLPAQNYYERKAALWVNVTTALDTLRREYELIIIEGAGSPVELNLTRGDIVNMAVARYLQSPVILVGDIDRGGIFPQLLGTLDLLGTDERALVRGLLVNKFRGDMSLFHDGVDILEQRSGVPVLGVIPYLHQHGIPEEDAVAIEPQNRQTESVSGLDIAVVNLPRIANFDDFDPLAAEQGVTVRYVDDALGRPDSVIVPGTKSTMADLQWLKQTGLARAIIEQAQKGVPIVGICGGFQMLGEAVHDPQQIESDQTTISGLGLLPIVTTFGSKKSTYQAEAEIHSETEWLKTLTGQTLSGYEIHMGQTVGGTPWHNLTRRNNQAIHMPAGAVSSDGRIWGSYLHGLFANANLRRAWLRSLGWLPADNALPADLHIAFDRLADHVQSAVDWSQLSAIIGYNP